MHAHGASTAIDRRTRPSVTRGTIGVMMRAFLVCAALSACAGESIEPSLDIDALRTRVAATSGSGSARGSLR